MSDSDDGQDDEVTLGFRKITQRAQSLNFDDEKAVESFVSELGETFTERNDSEETILHYMAARAMSENSPQHRLLKLLLQQPKGSALLAMEHLEDGTPLHIALQRRSNRKPYPLFVETALEFAHFSSLQKALGLKNNAVGNNCLHHAIQYEFRSIMKLISKCPRELYWQPNTKGNTPLHLAMALYVKDKPIRQNTGEQRAGQRKDELSLKWKKDRGVSQTRNEAVRAKDSDSHKQRGDSEAGGKNLTTQRISRAPTSSEIVSNSSKNMQAGRERPAASPNLPKPAASRISSPSSFYLPDVVKRLLSDSVIARNMLIHKNYLGQGEVAPYQYRIAQVLKNPDKHLRHMARPQTGQSDAVDIQHDPIAKYIKEYCLRNLEREDAIRILYEKGKGTLISWI